MKNDIEDLMNVDNETHEETSLINNINNGEFDMIKKKGFIENNIMTA